MQTCDVLVGGGGPAGSSCAWRLRQAGLDVLVVDRATFPRDKPCAGWITPQVVGDLSIDVAEYRCDRTLQPISGFRIGVIGDDHDVAIPYGRAVSFGVRRCEFDHYLLIRAGARLGLGTSIARIRRDGADWVINDEIRTPMLVGAGGHFCAVAAWMNGPHPRGAPAPLVVAQEAEFAVDRQDGFAVAPETPEFYFAPDLGGYGWLCRKQQYVNVGFGHVADGSALRPAVGSFVDWLEARGRVPARGRWPWRGHAYLLHDRHMRRTSGPGVVLAGDAAGLAYPQSGEGIRPAIESGLLAAQTILDAQGRYTSDNLAAYDARLRARFAIGKVPKTVAGVLPASLATALGRTLVGMPWFVRNFVIDRWFLHAKEPPLSA